ncbi:hypothetical protein FRC12_018196, partial [Ceratobasidium sp. 428]
MFTVTLLALISLFTMIQSTLAQQGPTQCHDPVMTRWMLNSEGENPCIVAQEVMRVCNPSFNISWLTSSYSCDNEPGSITAACCCGSPTFALLSACWSCQYNYTMDVVTTTFTSFEKDCSSIPTPLTSYDPIISSKVAQIDIPIWAKIEPPAGKWDLEGAWRNVTPVETTTPPIPTEYPLAPSPNVLSSGAIIGIIVGSVFGTALMFIIAAVILWKCLGIGRYRQQPAEDIHVGRDMGYLDGEYVYVQPVNPTNGPDGTLGVSLARRLTSRRDHRGGLRPRAEVDLDASDVSINRQLSDYEIPHLLNLLVHFLMPAMQAWTGSTEAITQGRVLNPFTAQVSTTDAKDRLATTTTTARAASTSTGRVETDGENATNENTEAVIADPHLVSVNTDLAETGLAVGEARTGTGPAETGLSPDNSAIADRYLVNSAITGRALSARGIIA